MITCNKSLSLTIIDASCLISTSTPLPSGTVNSVYNQAFAAVGTAPFVWSLFSGSLPPGITLSGAGVLSGTPTVSGTYNFTITTTDATALTCFKQFSLTIIPTCLAGGQNSPGELVWTSSQSQGTARDIFFNGSIGGNNGNFLMWAAANPHSNCFEVCGTGIASRTVMCTLCNPGPDRTLTVDVQMSGAERVSSCLNPPPAPAGQTGIANDCNLARNASIRIGGVQGGEVVEIVGSNFLPGQSFNRQVVASAPHLAGTAKNIYIIMQVNQMSMNTSIFVSWVPP